MKGSRRRLWLYGSLGGLALLIVAWWVVFFTFQGRTLVERANEAGAHLSDAQAAAVIEGTRQSLRMFLFEGLVLVLLLLAGVWLVIRSMREEVVLHRQQRELLSAVTHELKSPIASARLYVQSLRMGRVPAGKEDRYLANAEADLDRLGGMVGRLLEAARMSSGGRPQLRLERVDLSEFTSSAVPTYSEGRGLELELTAAPGVHVRADTEALEVILRNLIANAAKYGGDSSRLRIAVEERGGEAWLSVRDWGPGLSESEPEKLFQPFVRGEGDLVKSQPGVGLGLYLVAELTRALGGRVSARNVEEEGGGFSVQIALPLAGEAA